MRSLWLKLVAAFLLLGVALAGVVWLMRVSPAATEVITGALGLLASIFTSPFILEASLGLIGLVIVLTYNQYKREQDEKDEWVLLPRTETPEQPTDEAK